VISPQTTVQATPQVPTWDVQAASAKIANGMTKADVEAAVGKSATNCTVTDMGKQGKYEACSYGAVPADRGIIIVSYTNGLVTAKSTSTY
jgi:hypothetical protein